MRERVIKKERTVSSALLTIPRFGTVSLAFLHSQEDAFTFNKLNNFVRQ